MKSMVAAVVALFAIALLSLEVQPASAEVKVAAFNIKNLGMSRLDRNWLTGVIIRILCQYDFIFVQEMLTHQNTDRPVATLDAELNNFARDNYPRKQCRHPGYMVHHEGPLGTTSHREFYVFIYNSQVLRFSDIQIYQQITRIFERPPIVALMLLPTGDRLILIGVHTQPRNVERELNALSDVFAHAKGLYHIDAGFMIGDFNVDYLNHQRLESLPIVTDPNCHWLLRGVHTNVGRTATSQRRLYDQIVAVGQRAMQCYVPNSARVNNFENLVPNGHIPWEVSDHYPIEMVLRCPGHK